MTVNTEQTVREIALGNPATIRIFETLGIDYCCGGRRSLAEACASANVPVAKALELLSALGSEAKPVDEVDWSAASFEALIDHIVGHHHTYIRQEAPRLNQLAHKVVSKHGPNHPELASIQDLFSALSQELSAHLLKEEQILFPYLHRLEAARTTGAELPPSCFDSVEMPISRMLAEHDDAGALLARLRALSDNFQAPPEACPSFLGLYQGLEDFERDLHHHIHLENNILFPRAIQLDHEVNCHPVSSAK